MTVVLLQFLVSAAVIVAAGVVLTRAADQIAELTGLGRVLIGSVLLAGATSLPELSVDISAVRAGHDDIAVGDLMGSSLFNLSILAIADLAHKEPGRMLSRTAAAHAISATMAVLLTAVAGLMMLVRPETAVAGVGIGSAAVFVAYVLGIRVVSFDQRFEIAKTAGEVAAAPPRWRRNPDLRASALRFAAAAAAILAAAPFVADAAGTMAERSGLGGTFVGTTLVALTTSLPELIATLSAVRIGAFDLALGNIFGSNAFNMAMLLPIDFASSGPLLSSVSPTHAVTAMWIVVVTSVAVIGQLYHVEARRRLLEPDAAMILVLVLAALATVYGLGS